MRLKLAQTCDSEFKIKALEDGSVYVEGWANKAIVDRGKDLIGKKAWNLENYKKNSIMLFNHDHSKPIGKMMTVEARDEGLYVKGRISNSKDPEISRIRDLVKEGILNSLSVGIMVSDEENRDGVNMVKSAELHEVSVVAVPMNQDSQFTVSAKSMQGSLVDTIELISAEVGFNDVAKACQLLHADDTLYLSVDEIATKIAEEAGVTKDKALSFLRMHEASTPEEIKTWIDKACEHTEDDTNKIKAEGKEVQAIKVPKASFESMEALQAWAQESGWSVENIQETEDSYLLVQKPVDAFQGDLSEIDMGDGVMAMVGDLAIVEESTEEMEPVEAEVVEETDAEEKGLLDNADPMTQPITGNTAANVEVNPPLDQAKQTNVLLANMVMLLQQMNEKMDMMTGSTPKVEVEVETPEPETEDSPEMGEAEEMAKKIESFMLKTTERLSQLGL